MGTKTTFTESDEGKEVVDSEGKTVGQILEITHGLAYVSPDPDYATSALREPEDGGRDDGTYAIGSDRISTITAEEVYLE
jgi:hypothetical protein